MLDPTASTSSTSDIARLYAEVLQRAVFARDALALEMALTEASDLGRDLIALEIPLEEVGELHHEALMRLSRANPDLPLSQIAARITAPLMEATMAYSLAFREQLERRASALVNARLEQSRRLEAVGTLAAGIAHDFNNILGAILGFSELLEDELAPESAGRHHLAYIQQASFRARDLIARMLTFARDLADSPVPVEVVALVRETLALLRASLPAGARVEFTPAVDEAWVLAEPSQIQQIVMNLCINAADAIGQAQGRIEIGVEWVRRPEGTPAARADLVRLSVSDDGEGMTPEVRERVFDPFFTTKAPGKGSGLGLSVIHGLVGKLGGQIRIESAPGRGSRFVIELPRLIQGADTAPDSGANHSERST
ncbi:sensor histidine kinase [Allochromatium vinosum]|uniref:histidine kinase n=1 Tax=Allochromatium vinosum (strain ATCC 17899 / DSM 180 / NBRC 103801 / NCIMB 10441 / D) TaxID=572477 RepID=D3RNM6_ALLVD|nr:ATP-binding protein [Allochromatium vinosum]ADC63391.1 histidine kinase [Allochromatium vinosum DSM 180]